MPIAAFQLKFHLNLIDLFTWVVRQGTDTHTQLLFSITWAEMASGCGLALSFCCSQRHVPEALAETYLWSARVHYPSDNGSGVTAGGVFARQWCLAAWCVSTQCIPEPTAAQQNHSVIKRCLAFIPTQVCDFQTYRCILIYYLLDSVPLQTTCNMTARRMKGVLFFSEYVLFQWKALGGGGGLLQLATGSIIKFCHG